MSLASLFGPSAIQIAYSGQAIVGVAVSVVQYTSAAAEYKAGGSTIQTKGEKDTANLGSFLFFGLGALFLGCSLIAHTALTYTSAYKAATTPYTEPDDEPVIDEDDLDQVEDQPFLGVAGSQIPGKHSILQVAKVNWMYNVAVAYIFVVTLVSPFRKR
jgi:equilibrative nucleoside transporter 1/2/3